MYISAQCYPDRAVGKEINLLLVKCANHTSGCPWQGKLADFEVDYRANVLVEVYTICNNTLHPQGHDCKYRPQLCSNEGCGKLIPKSDLKNHEKNKCAFRTVTCRYCGLKTVFNRLEVRHCRVEVE